MAPPQQGQPLSSTSTRTSTRGRCAGRAPRLRRRDPGRPRGAAPCRHLLLRRLGGGHGLLEVLQAELQLVGVEPLRAPAEPAALQLPDQQPQLLDLGLRRVALRESLGDASARPDSIALDLESSASGALGGDDFRHMPQLLQQPLGVSREIIQRQRHGAILLAESRESQHFRSPGRARARDRAGLEPVPRQALEQGRELRAAQPDHALRRRGPAEPPGLQPLRCTRPSPLRGTAAKDLRLDASPRVGVEALRALARWMVRRHGAGAATGASGELVRSAGRAPPEAGGADRADGAATARHGSGSSGDRP